MSHEPFGLAGLVAGVRLMAIDSARTRRVIVIAVARMAAGAARRRALREAVREVFERLRKPAVIDATLQRLLAEPHVAEALDYFRSHLEEWPQFREALERCIQPPAAARAVAVMTPAALATRGLHNVRGCLEGLSPELAASILDEKPARPRRSR